tara:strand:+ start:57 stop:398 length:342 start_codon:yes stop_codon:yes gene_type:complete
VKESETLRSDIVSDDDDVQGGGSASAASATSAASASTLTSKAAALTATEVAQVKLQTVISGFPFAPQEVIKAEKKKGLVSSTWDGDLHTFIEHVKPCPYCSFPQRGSGCGYCH